MMRKTILFLICLTACSNSDTESPPWPSKPAISDPSTTETGDGGAETGAVVDLPSESPEQSSCEVDCATHGDPCAVIDDCAPGLDCFAGSCRAPT